MFYSTRSRLIVSFSSMSFLVGIVSLIIGVTIVYQTVHSEAFRRVNLDLYAARDIYSHHIQLVETSLKISARGLGMSPNLDQLTSSSAADYISQISGLADLDFAGVVDKNGRTLHRIGPTPHSISPASPENPIAALVIEHKASISGTMVLSNAFLSEENPELAQRARIPLTSESNSSSFSRPVKARGLAIAAGVPIIQDGAIVGALYGGILLNRDLKIVDKVNNTIFHQEIYEGRNIGKTSIFFDDIRISTSVRLPSERRAIGTLVSSEVKTSVLEKGERWINQTSLLNDWHIAAYEPIEDMAGNRVGILGVAVEWEKYQDIITRALSIFILTAIIGMVLATGLGYLLAQRIMKPVYQLVTASQRVSEGDLSPEIGPPAKGEIGILQATFRQMVEALQARRTQRLAESENQLLRTEQQASIGRFAAGVAHEINNPLTGVLTYTHMLLRREDIDNDIRSDLQTIVAATERVRRIVKGLLDFSRQTELDRESADVNRLVRSTLTLVENQALLKGISIEFHPGDSMPNLILDRSQFRSVMLNIILNAVDATVPGGSVNIYTATGLSAGTEGKTGVEITIADTGCGIPRENLDKIFDPFFTTKDVGQGTGLGLAVSFGIVRRHGGTIRVQSEVGKGTRFFVWLPISE